jgi:hypothetical protein
MMDLDEKRIFVIPSLLWINEETVLVLAILVDVSYSSYVFFSLLLVAGWSCSAELVWWWFNSLLMAAGWSENWMDLVLRREWTGG